MAQLIIGGKNYGPHPFVCQIRDMKTHEPLDGVHVGSLPIYYRYIITKTNSSLLGTGDIGPKFGYKQASYWTSLRRIRLTPNSTMDNGFLLLNNVKIPHVNMLAR